MTKLALYVPLQAKPGKEKEVAVYAVLASTSARAGAATPPGRASREA